MRRAGAAVLAALALAGCASQLDGAGPGMGSAVASAAPAPSFPPPTFTLNGTFKVGPSYFTCTGCEGFDGRPAGDWTCWTIGALRNVRAGTTVRVTSGEGVLLGLGRLDGGSAISDPEYPDLPAWCMFDFTVPEVPLGQRFYTVSVGSAGGVEYREDEVTAPLVTISYQ